MPKVMIVGDPHSGKSVLVRVLSSLLPRALFSVIEGAPDGEGITGWSHCSDAGLVKQVRRKGKFLENFVADRVESVRHSTTPITIVDVGGRRSEENCRIAAVCTHLLVVSNSREGAMLWQEWGESLGLATAAVLYSTLEGEDEISSLEATVRGQITHLEREDPPYHSTTAKAVAARLIALTQSEGHGLDGSETADVNFPAVSLELDLPVVGADREWVPASMPALVNLIASQVAGKTEIRLWGNCSSGLPYHVLACALEQPVAYYDPKLAGYVGLPENAPDGTGTVLDWQVGDRDGCSLAEFVISEQILPAGALPAVIPPAVDVSRGVIISGKGPWWLTGMICRSYHRAGVPWVAIFAPRESVRHDCGGQTWTERNPGCAPAIIVASRDEKLPVGTVIPFRL